MKTFKYIQDVEEWLEPMDYVGFWYAIAPYRLPLQGGHDKEHCDECIAVNGVAEKDILSAVKWFACLELTEMYNLERRPITPWLKLVETH